MTPIATPDLVPVADVAPPASSAAVATEIVVPTMAAPADTRGIALKILATIAVVGALSLAQTFFVSLLLGIIIAYTLNPLVVYLERIKVPRVAGTIVVMMGVMSALGFSAYSLRGQMQTIIEQLPEATRTFSSALSRMRVDPTGNLQKMQSAASEVEKATTRAAGAAPAPRQAATHVVIEPPGFRLNDFLLEGSKGASVSSARRSWCCSSTFFLLVGGDRFKRKLVRLTGPSLSKKKITVQILDDINDSIQKYLFMLLLTDVLVGLLAWIALHWIGLENAGAWAVASGLLHVVPYLGPGVTAGAIGMAAFMQFGSFPMAFLACGASLAIATLVGTFVTTWMTGRIANMNAAGIFISLLFWGWLWGSGGCWPASRSSSSPRSFPTTWRSCSQGLAEMLGE